MSRIMMCGLFLSLCSAFPASAHGDLLVGNKTDDTVWRLSLRDGSAVAKMPSGQGPHEIAVSPDGNRAVVTDYGHQAPGHSLTVIDLAGNTVRGHVDLGEHQRPHGVRFLPDGRHVLVTTEHSRSLLVVDLDDRRVVRAIDIGAGLGHMVALSKDAAVAYVSKLQSGTVSRIALKGGDEVREQPAGEGAEGIEVAPDGAVWVTNRAADTVTVHDPDTLAIRAILPSAGFPIRVVFTPSGSHALVTNAKAGTLSVFDARMPALVKTVSLITDDVSFKDTMLGQGAMPIGVIVDPVQPRAYVAISGADRVAVLDTEAWEVVDYWHAGTQPDALGIVGDPSER